MPRRPRWTALPLAVGITSWAFAACGFSTTEPPSSLAGVRVLVDLEHRTERQPDGRDAYEFNRVNVVLTNDEGTALELPEVAVLMNGEPLTFVVGRGNYYDRHPRYTLAQDAKQQMREDAAYTFAVRWSDQTLHPAGSARTPKTLTLSQISLPEIHAAGRPLEIRWRHLAETCELAAYRGFEYPDVNGNLVREVGSVNGDDVLRKTIGPGNGSMTVPTSYFATQGNRRVASFGVEITRAAETSIAKAFAAGSRIAVARTLALRTEITKE